MAIRYAGFIAAPEPADGSDEDTAPVVARDRRSMRFVSAGHLPLLLCRGGAARFLDHHGVLLGVNLSCFTARWSSCCPETDWSSSPTRLPIEQVADHLLDAAGDSDDDVAR